MTFGFTVFVVGELFQKTRVNVLTRMRYILEVIISKIPRDYEIKDTIVISGTPRGGTTWLMEILATLPEYKTIFEPLKPSFFPEVRTLGFPPRVYIPPDKDWPVVKKYLIKVFTGRKFSTQPAYSPTPYNIYKRFIARKLIVKFVRANRLLPWIYNNFDLRGIYFIIRHPCATIASQ